MSKHADSVDIDAYGSTGNPKGRSAKAPTVMLEAHADDR